MFNLKLEVGQNVRPGQRTGNQRVINPGANRIIATRWIAPGKDQVGFNRMLDRAFS